MQSYLKHWKRITDRDGVLYRRIMDQHGNEIYQFLLTTALRETLLESLHDKSGHQAQEPTELLIRARCFWPTLQKDVSAWIAGCQRCTVSKMPYHKVRTSQTPNRIRRCGLYPARTFVRWKRKCTDRNGRIHEVYPRCPNSRSESENRSQSI